MPSDDSLMNRFDQQGLRRFRARDAIVAVLICSFVLILFEGPSIRREGERMSPGPGRTLVLAVGKPAGWLGDQLPLASVAHDATAWLSPDDKLDAADSFANVAVTNTGVPPVTPDAFDQADLSEPAAPKEKLGTLLVTGDSLSQPLDSELARLLSPKGVKVVRDPHLGSGISKSFLVDWGQLSADQVRKHKPDAIVVMIGANEGYPITVGGKDVKCCGADWASAYANRARRMLATYRQGGLARIYWITVPLTRDPKRAAIANVVDASIAVAAQPWRRQVRVIDSRPIFTPDGYRDAMPINGKETIVRASDGIHLNEPGSKLLAENVLGRINRDFTVG
jgi:hypothetical protein